MTTIKPFFNMLNDLLKCDDVLTILKVKTKTELFSGFIPVHHHH